MASESERALNYETVLVYVDGDVQLLSELAEFFLQDYSRLMGEARGAILQGDCPGLERAAHTMKGRLAFFGVGKLREEIFSLETMGRECNLSGALELLDQFETGMKAILPEFKSLILEQKS
ncbi:MAG: domain S-box [Acidobacteria bacterium]|nr:domain S-box [Acidobacteriota bacterium]